MITLRFLASNFTIQHAGLWLRRLPPDWIEVKEGVCQAPLTFPGFLHGTLADMIIGMNHGATSVVRWCDFGVEIDKAQFQKGLVEIDLRDQRLARIAFTSPIPKWPISLSLLGNDAEGTLSLDCGPEGCQFLLPPGHYAASIMADDNARFVPFEIHPDEDLLLEI